MKNHPLKLLLMLALIIASCSKEESNLPQEEVVVELESQELLSIETINTQIAQTLSSTGDFNWNDTSDQFLWSGVMHGSNILTIGYGDSSFNEKRDAKIEKTKDDLIALVLEEEFVSKRSLQLVVHEIINVLDIKVTSINTIKALRNNPNVRYLEANGYNKYETTESVSGRMLSSSGCSKSGETINTSHYTPITPNNAQVSWHFYKHNIPQAWNYSTGQGVTVGLIDTGVSKSQTLLNSSGFNDGYSSGRSVEKHGTFIDSNWFWSSNYDGPHDKCGHGTLMASTIAAPRNDNGMPVGVAYNSNLVAYRATEDVVLNDYHERKGVSKALTQLGNRSDVKIISMSIGYPWSIGNIKDAVKYAYSKGKLIFAAGGTSTSFTNWYGVIFPATMSQTVGVTGITDGAYYEVCDVCHEGDDIDFTIIMEGDNNTSKHAPVLGFYNNQRQYVGGSSVATATMAGIAALVWAKHPSWSRSQVLDKLKQSSHLYPNSHSSFGYGIINALEAVQ